MFGSFLPSLRSSNSHSLLGSRSRHCYAIKLVYDCRICSRLKLAVFTSDRNSRGSMHVSDVVVHGENLFEVGFVRTNVDHPGEHLGVEVSPFGCACLLSVYGAEHAELGMGSLVVLYAVFRGPADVDVP